MLGDVLIARYHWNRAEVEAACRRLNAALDPSEPVFALTPTEVERFRAQPFEVFVANLLLTENISRDASLLARLVSVRLRLPAEDAEACVRELFDGARTGRFDALVARYAAV
jgi:hypothetical protein